MRSSVWLVLIGAILWGTTGTAQALAPEESTPLVVGALRLLIGGGSLFLLVYFQKRLSIKGIPKKPLLISAIAMALYQPFFFSGVDLTGVAIGTVIAICSAPIFAGLMEGVIHKRLPDLVWAISTVLAVVGCLLLFQSGETVTFNFLGMMFSLMAGLAFAIYTFVSKDLVTNYPSDVVVAVVFSTAAIFLLPILFVYDTSWLVQSSGAISMLHLGLIATALAYLLFARGLKGIPASMAVTLALAEPVTAALLGILLLGEPLTIVSGFGLLLLIIGLLLLANKPKVLNYITARKKS
ncbi:EamA family transporter [Alkalibacillus haloalkaliphilus]|uniref:Putative transporter YwfM n=1 Tax=Alkalibacillus haloalkaliphilus TaxID=94136 RepID=A0A511W4R1_9BACI|nr:EamA family transporter [Alkalibacillus haloalkaliphilus]GEN46094.1 putative transporter YwfM [Alkalibacillus haloalkaliphilus]